MSGAARAAKQAVKLAAAVGDKVVGPLPGPRILIYHQVGAGTGLEMEVTIEDFRRQLDWLSVNGEVVDLETAVASRALPASSRMFVLTFDDGYADVYSHAFPLLRERRLPFTLYLTTDPIETGNPLRNDGTAKPLNWDQVGEMVEQGLVTIGAHTHSHPDLRAIDEAAVADEVGRSNRLIDQRIGVEPRHFTYPWGYWSPQADRVVRSAYETATLGSGRAVTGATDPLLINRVPVQLSDGTAFFRHRMVGGLRLEDRVRRLVRGYRGP